MSKRYLMKGNEAVAEAAVMAGCRHFFGYPITPQTEINAYMSKRMPQVGGIYLQAESEIAAINMTLGASATGARAMTSSSSPGIALKTEGISYMCGCDLPCVIVNIQRGGPGLGGIQPSQADYYLATRAPGHGDLRMLVFAPATVQEMFDTVFTAFDAAELYRMPAMLLADGLLGQMMEPVTPPALPPAPREKLWALGAGAPKRKTISSLYLKPEELEEVIRLRFARYSEAETRLSACEEYLAEDARVLLVAYGATSRIARAAVTAAREKGHKAGLFRPKTLWPFPKEQLRAAAAKAGKVLVVEMSMGQMVSDVRLAVGDTAAVGFFGRTGGVVPLPEELLERVEALI